MKHIPTIGGILLGLLFIMSSVVVLFHLVPMPEIPKDTPASHFMNAFGPSGYMTFVKVCELLGGILVMVPRTRSIGLLVLGPIIVNILAYHAFVMKGEGLLNPMLIVICLLPVYLMWADRKKWCALCC